MNRPHLLLVALAACKSPQAPPPPPEPDVYEIPEGWPTEGDPWAAVTARAGCTQVGDNGDTYTFDGYGWLLSGAAGDGAWSFDWTYVREADLVTEATEVEVYGDAGFTTEYTYDANQIVEDERSQGQLRLECRNHYFEAGLSRDSTCTSPDGENEVVTTYDWCNQARVVQQRGEDPVLEVTYASGCLLASTVEQLGTVTITREYDADGRESVFTFDRASGTEVITYAWTCE